VLGSLIVYHCLDGTIRRRSFCDLLTPEKVFGPIRRVTELDNSLCSLEMARTYWVLHQQNPALMLLHSISSSTGERLKYLCRKDDALRKDMRMVEFASFVNHILSRDRQCHQRDLAVMTFAVVCLNERCAMIEWVDQTRALRAIVEELLCDGMANAPHICRTRYKSFVPHILPGFRPVMYMSFVAHFKVIARWFQTRL
jgi:serine/threonine-protein kinase ATR